MALSETEVTPNFFGFINSCANFEILGTKPMFSYSHVVVGKSFVSWVVPLLNIQNKSIGTLTYPDSTVLCLRKTSTLSRLWLGQLKI